MNTQFHYSKSTKIKRLFIAAIVVSLPSFLFKSDTLSFQTILLTLLAIELLFLLLFYMHLFNNSIEITANQLLLKRKIGFNNVIEFRNISRLVIQGDVDSLTGQDSTKMLAFYSGKCLKINISDLSEKTEMLRLLDQKSEAFGFKLIYQDSSGAILEHYRAI